MFPRNAFSLPHSILASRATATLMGHRLSTKMLFLATSYTSRRSFEV